MKQQMSAKSRRELMQMVVVRYRSGSRTALRQMHNLGHAASRCRGSWVAMLKTLLVRCGIAPNLIWLATYKFKDWVTTETRKVHVSAAQRERRAEEIANILMDNRRWGSHGRGIPMSTLRGELNLRIDDFGQIPKLSSLIRQYYSLAVDYVVRNKIGHLAHSRCFL